MPVFVHDRGLCESEHVGEGTRIWAFAHVLPGARIGVDGNICDHVFIENDVVLGDRVTVKCGVQLWDGVRLGDDVFVGPNATFTNDPFPRSKQHPEAYARTVVGDGASIGAGAVVLPGLTIGRHAMVGAGAVVTRDVPPHAVVRGNPARITGYVETGAGRDRAAAAPPGSPAAPAGDDVTVPGVALLQLRAATDLRGSLATASFSSDLPFVPKRTSTVYDVPSRDVRREHAHRVCEQVLVCVSGSVSVLLDDGVHRQELLLDRPDVGLHVPAMVWASVSQCSRDTVLLVLASEDDDPDDVLGDHEQFLAERAR